MQLLTCQENHLDLLLLLLIYCASHAARGSYCRWQDARISRRCRPAAHQESRQARLQAALPCIAGFHIWQDGG